jgi:2,4-dienoyl-CoA reductase-like NADH-dependent reductase (Old Yellow Enzyme family)/NADPH-dependent 2,4-dienoyl-CoA reductase/sulfur reductase-like enzyme
VFASPVTTNRVVDHGYPTAEGIDVYETRARGGFAQVTFTESFVDNEFASRHEHGLNVYSNTMSTVHIESILTLTESIKAHGAVASIQLNHVGNVNHPDTCAGRKNPIGPSAFTRPDGVRIDEMDEAMMERVAQNYANAAGNCKALGFDMVMLHGGHGWLLSQFISPLSNHRKDTYGGSLENRARFPLMVIEAVREQCGEDFLIEYRVSGDERVDGGMHIEETAEFCKLIQDKVDLIHVTSGIYHSHVETKAFSSMFDPHGCNLDLAYAIKKAVRIPVVAVGGFNSPEQVEEAVKNGNCDFVALGRQQFADPAFVNKAMTGRADEIAPCLRCSCFNPLPADPGKRPIPELWHCTVNPWSGRELRWRQAPGPRGKRRVLVIGGGVSGMYAAITAAERGHDVILAEKNGELGGLLWFTDIDEHKESLRRFRDSLITRCRRAGVDIRLGTEVTEAYITGMKPDAVIVAAGSRAAVPPIPGIENAVHALDVYSLPGKPGRKIVMIGGGLIGCETGLWLACGGHEVHILEMRGDMALEGNDSHRRALLPLMKKHLTWETLVTVTLVDKRGVHYTDSGGDKKSVEADTVVYAVGQRPNNEISEKLRNAGIVFTAAGDCVRPRQVKQAVYEGFCAAMDVL